MSNQGETWLGCSRIRWAFWNLTIVDNLINIRVCLCVYVCKLLWRYGVWRSKLQFDSVCPPVLHWEAGPNLSLSSKPVRPGGLNNAGTLQGRPTLHWQLPYPQSTRPAGRVLQEAIRFPSGCARPMFKTLSVLSIFSL